MYVYICSFLVLIEIVSCYRKVRLVCYCCYLCVRLTQVSNEERNVDAIKYQKASAWVCAYMKWLEHTITGIHYLVERFGQVAITYLLRTMMMVNVCGPG